MRDDLEKIKEEIRQLYQHSPSAESIKEIESVWNDLEEVCYLAEAKMRLLIKRQPPVILAPEPDNFRSIHNSLTRNTDDISACPSCVADDTISLVRVLIGKYPEIDANIIRISKFGFGTAEVSFGKGFLWLIQRSYISFPGIRARVMYSNNTGLKPKNFYYAGSLIDHTIEFLKGR